MNARVNHGPCKQCGAPVLYLGAEFCSPRCHQAHAAPRPVCEQCNRFPQEDDFTRRCVGCNVTPPIMNCELCKRRSETRVCVECEARVPVEKRELIVLDCETQRMVPGCQAPPLACVGWATRETYGLLHWSEAKPMVVSVLEGDFLMSGHHVSTDSAVFCANWPDVIPLVFNAYWNDRITDTLLRQKLIDIATTGRTAFEYNLGAVAKRRLGVAVDKKDEWRLRFGELIPYPLEQWPEAALRYAQLDPIVTLGIHDAQEADNQWLLDQYRQARADFWIELMSIWGLHTSPEGVREFSSKTQQEYDRITHELVAVGLMREKRTKKKATGQIEVTYHKNTKVAQELMERAWSSRSGDAQPNQTTKGISVAKDNCKRSGEPLLEKYAEHSSIGTLISNFIPILWEGVHTPIHGNFDSLLVTGRTSMSPNCQNFPAKKIGPRECFVPRPGFVYAIGDYSGMELHSWSEVCFALFGFSDMGEALNAGIDPHTQVAAAILGIPYQQAVEEYDQDPRGRVYLPRQSGKVADFGAPGGLGVKRLIEYARSNYGVVLDEKQARDLKQAWLRSWREARKYLDWGSAQGQPGSIMIQQLFVGRFRGACSYTEALNSLFQGLAADCAKAAGFLISYACYADTSSILYGCRLVHFVHDEFLIEVPDDYYAHDRAMELARLMKLGADQYLTHYPSRVEPFLARRWSKAAKAVFSGCTVCGSPEGEKCKPKGEHHNVRRLVPWDLDQAA